MILFQKNKIKFDEDLINNTKNGFETYIKMGEGIGEKIVDKNRE
jgi:phosphatidylserine decarboxylase